MPQHIDPLLKNPAYELQQAVCVVLSCHFSSTELEQHVIPLFKDPHWAVVKTAACALGKLKLLPLSVKNALIEVALNHPAPSTKHEARDALLKHGTYINERRLP